MSDDTQPSTPGPTNFDARRASRASRKAWAPNVAIASLPPFAQEKIRKPHLLKAFSIVKCPQSGQYHCVAVIGRSFVLVDHPNPAGELALAAMVGKEIVRCRCHELRDYWATLRYSSAPGTRAYCTNLSDFPEALRELRERCRLPARDARKLSSQLKTRFGKRRRVFDTTSISVPDREHPLPSGRAIGPPARLRAQTAVAGTHFRSAFEASLIRLLPPDFQLDFEWEFAAPLGRLRRSYGGSLHIEVDARLWWARIGYWRREVICARWFVLAVAPTVSTTAVLAWCIDLDAFVTYLTTKSSLRVDPNQAIENCNVSAIITDWSRAQPQVLPLAVTAPERARVLNMPAAHCLTSFKSTTT